MSNDSKRFVTIYKQGNGFTGLKQVFVDKETGVNYIFVIEGYGGGLTVLLDQNGKPVITRDIPEL